ncbi:MAG: helix-turn-helix domain-containing protein [Acidimicrobiia bacterium]|nr:helix-turn-helix domain-containing protein [Acidimicrobiia bacterium]MCY4434356.1 helix-turn-helix transcriptional regulator [bacterium]
MDQSAVEAFGNYLRSQRKLAQLTLRELSDLAEVSNPYLSQLERGLHQPSVRVIKSLATALNLSAETLLAQAAGIDAANGENPDGVSDTEATIRSDANLSDEQKAALLEVYRSMTSGGQNP